MARRRKTRGRRNASTASLSMSQNASDIQEVSSTPSVGVRVGNMAPHSASPIRDLGSGNEDAVGNQGQQLRGGPDRNNVPPTSVPLPVGNQAAPASGGNRFAAIATQETPRGTGTELPGREIVTQVSELLLPVLSRLESLEARLNDNVANGIPGGLRGQVLGTAMVRDPTGIRQDTASFARDTGQHDRRIRFQPTEAASLLAGNMRQEDAFGSHNRPSAFTSVAPSSLPSFAANNLVQAQAGGTKSQHLKTSDIKIPIYSGCHEVRTPYEFLMDLERYRQAVGYTQAEMLAQVVPLALRDDAEMWYRKARHRFETWLEFQSAFRREFQSPTYNRKLRRELEDRFQGPHEPLTKFIYVIDDYFQRLDPTTPQKARADRIIQNMHPDYRRKILTISREFSSVEEILNEAYEAQASLAWDREYRVPDIRGSIEPTLAYKIPGWTKPQEQVASLHYQRNPGNNGNIPEIQASSYDRYAYFHQQNGQRQAQVRFDHGGDRNFVSRPKSPGFSHDQTRNERSQNSHEFRPISPHNNVGQRPVSPSPQSNVANSSQSDRNGSRPATPYRFEHNNNRPQGPGQNNSRPTSPYHPLPRPTSPYHQSSRPTSPHVPQPNSGNGQNPSRA